VALQSIAARRGKDRRAAIARKNCQVDLFTGAGTIYVWLFAAAIDKNGDAPVSFPAMEIGNLPDFPPPVISTTTIRVTVWRTNPIRVEFLPGRLAPEHPVHQQSHVDCGRRTDQSHDRRSASCFVRDGRNRHAATLPA
jgi:hypothetical protein